MIYKRWSFINEKHQLIESPIFIFDKVGKFYPGSVVDRLLSFPKIIYEKKSFCRNGINNLKTNIVKRLIYEEQRDLHLSKTSLTLCLSRHDRISPQFLRKLDEEENFIRSKLNI